MAERPAPSNPVAAGVRRLLRPAPVIIVGTVMFTFISYWRTAAIVLNDLASTAYYIGGIAESAIGKAAPWFILAVMLFSYAVRSVYIESCSMFVRGGVYRVVREAMGGTLGKLSVSALLFDYVLTGPISGVSAGQYLMGLSLESLALIDPNLRIENEAHRQLIRNWGAVLIAIAITLYFFRQNLIGIHESSEKALKIMIATAIMGVIMLVWCGITLAVRDRNQINTIPFAPNLSKKVEYETVRGKDPITGEERDLWLKDPKTGELVVKLDAQTGEPVPRIDEVTHRQQDPLGAIGRWWPDFANELRNPGNWWTILGLMGLVIAFGHSILAMSGEETLAQVYREVESPKLKNFRKAALVVFIYSLLLTGAISFLAVLLIPDEVRMKDYKDNLIGGLAMYVAGPPWARLLLNAVVTVIGFMILSGAVNTSIIGSNGVLNRVAEDGVLPATLQKPHPRFGTTYRLLYLVVGMQILTILASQGDVLLLGEAYAFGVVWSFVFKALAMVVLRFRDRRPREAKVPLNVRVGGVEIPIGLSLIFLVLACAAIANLFTKEIATIGGLTFTAVFFSIFMVTEYLHRRKHGRNHEHLEQFNKQVSETVDPALLELDKPYRKLVAIRSPQNLFMLEKALMESDPETTDVVVMTAKVIPAGDGVANGNQQVQLDDYDQHLMTAVVTTAENIGKEVKPLIVPTNNPLFAIVQAAKQIKAQEVVVGASNKFTAEEFLDQITLYWMSIHGGTAAPLTIRILGRNWDVRQDLGGGNRIPKISEMKARSVAELRAAGVGIDRVILVHDGTPDSSDLFQNVLTILDDKVGLTLVRFAVPETATVDGPSNGSGTLFHDQERAAKLDREVDVRTLHGDFADELIKLAKEEKYDLIIFGLPSELVSDRTHHMDERVHYLLRHAPCQVFLATSPSLPQELEEQPKA